MFLRLMILKKMNAVEIALRMTDNDYCVKIANSVFESIEEAVSNATEYIDEESANIGSEGIDEFEITESEFVRAKEMPVMIVRPSMSLFIK